MEPPREASQPQPWPLPRWVRPPSALVTDIAIVALVGAVQISASMLVHHDTGTSGGHRSLDAFGVVLLAVSAIALAARRQRPVPVLVVTTATVMLYYLLGYPGEVAFLSLYVAFFTAVVTGHRLAAWVGAVA